MVASNRGPLSFTVSPGGVPVPRRGGGGLVSGLAQAARAGTVTWVCAALTPGDRLACAQTVGGRLDQAGFDTGGTRVRMLDLAEAPFALAYDVVANRTLWFLAHLLFDTATRPSFDAAFATAWAAFRDVNAAFADALAEEAPPGGSVLVQDYHLALTPQLLRARRPDLRIAHFTHTPWAPAEYFRILPDELARQVLLGMLGADHVGFLTRRWARAFLDCVSTTLGATPRQRTASRWSVDTGGRTVSVGVHALGVDGAWLHARAAQADVAEEAARLRSWVCGHRLIVRVDRAEPAKNIVRGLLAYAELLATYPQWRGRVVHLAVATPSRSTVPEYRSYFEAVRRTAQEVNDRFGTGSWTPLRLAEDDNYPRSLAALAAADVLVVNPVRDGMNLVAKEGPLLSRTNLALVLSREAGAAEEVGDEALVVNPYDVVATAAAIHQGLNMSDSERAARAGRLAAAATALPPGAWLAEQLAALRRDHAATG